MIRIFDCSNSLERPMHRGHGGPFTNDIIRYLKETAEYFNCTFTHDIKRADVLLTNDVFPKALTSLPLPKVKRMDGVYFQSEYENRNHSLNESAKIADHVIFISEFSKRSYFGLYNDIIKSNSVVLNQCDPNTFYPKRKTKLEIFVAYSTNWERKEKRLDAIIEFAKLNPGKAIWLIGSCSCSLPKNVITFGYESNHREIAETLWKADAMVCFAHKDACPKTVVQGVACGLPVLYANSGGVPEIVPAGVSVKDNNEINFEAEQPELNREEIFEASKRFKQNYIELHDITFDHPNKFYEMLDGYFSILKSF